MLCNHFVFFFNDTATTEIYTLSLHDALPISERDADDEVDDGGDAARHRADHRALARRHRVRRLLDVEVGRSEEHTSELQSRQYLVCRLLLEKKKNITLHISTTTIHYLIDTDR